MAGGCPVVIECVPNFSEGRDPLILAEIAAAIRETPDVRLFDTSADPDHHRSVFTFAGPPAAVIRAMQGAARVAVERIDLRGHHGVHPRIGAVDVVPFVPVSGSTVKECAGLARSFGEWISNEIGVPVFFYEPGRRLEEVRRMAREGAPPDLGEGRHPTAGACAVGARDFLIAWNIWLETADLDVARRIARSIRFSSGGLPGVKALGLPLASQGIVQVSINSTDFRATPLDVIYRHVRKLAGASGIAVRGSELIGMIPSAALEGASDLDWLNLSPERILPAVW